MWTNFLFEVLLALLAKLFALVAFEAAVAHLGLVAFAFLEAFVMAAAVAKSEIEKGNEPCAVGPSSEERRSLSRLT